MATVSEFETALDKLTARQLEDGLVKWLEEQTGEGPFWDYSDTKKANIRRITRWVRGNRERIDLVTARAEQLTGEAAASKVAARGYLAAKIAWARRNLPEAEQVLDDFDRVQPRKFYEELEVIPTPASFNPSAQGDFAFTRSYSYDGKKLVGGPAYSYETMLSEGVNPYGRTVDVPPGVRVWIATYDGQWGGRWARVKVFMHPSELQSLPTELRLALTGG
ncbi:MAG: hypothetical protein Q8R28_14970 [Dehalococcoidia bacterium]|nr:hypothetical protein [Dehalococcoidia bacterium]